MIQPHRFKSFLTVFLLQPLSAQPAPGQMAAQHHISQATMQTLRMAETAAMARKRANLRRATITSQISRTNTLEAGRKPAGEAWRFEFYPEAHRFGLPDGNHLPVLRKVHMKPNQGSRSVWMEVIEMLDLRSGKLAWGLPPVEGSLSVPVLLEDLMLSSNEKFELIALERDSGKERFRAAMDAVKPFTFDHRYPTVSEVVGSPEGLFVTTNGKSPQGTATSRAYAFDRNTGKRLWFKEWAVTPIQAPLVSDGIVVLAVGPQFYGINASSGEVKWEIKDPGLKPKDGGFTLGSKAFLPCESGKLLIVDPRTGTRVMTIPIPSSHGMIMAEGNHIFLLEYFVFGRPKAWAFDASTGKALWSQYVESETLVGWIQDGAVLLQQASTLRCLDLQDGKERWVNTYDEKPVGFATPLADHILFGTTNRKSATIRLLNFRSGKESWSIPIQGKGGTTPTLGVEDTILFVTAGNHLVGLR